MRLDIHYNCIIYFSACSYERFRFVQVTIYHLGFLRYVLKGEVIFFILLLN